jgi:hypothetical protein
VVADQLVAAAGEDGRATGEARPILLAAAGGEPSDAPPLRVDGTADQVVGPATGIGQPPTELTPVTRGRGTERCQRRRANEG